MIYHRGNKYIDDIGLLFSCHMMLSVMVPALCEKRDISNGIKNEKKKKHR